MDLKEIIRQHYLKFLEREPDPEGLEHYLLEIKNNRIKPTDLEVIFKNSDEGKAIAQQKERISNGDIQPISIYNDIRVQGKTISLGYRNSEKRYDEIYKFCKKFNRPISVLDLGAAEGYFTFRLSEDFTGVFIAVENDPKRKLLDLCIKNNNHNVMLLNKKMNLDDLKLLKEVQHFDIVLALNIIHHFDEPFQSVLDTLVSMSSYCFLEHPNSFEDNSVKNFERIKLEKLNIDKYDPVLLNKTESGIGNSCNRKLKRDLWLLTNVKPKTIDRGWREGAKYEDQFGPGKQIHIKSNFDKLEVEYGRREEKRKWIHGIDLRTFLESTGVYPTNNKIIEMIDNLVIKNPKDLGPHNLILTGNTLYAIDQKEKFDDVNTPEKLKQYLIKNRLLE
jgi:2-polyprenyl-3-methyl-5-hydroxy-6-metoxy-1,4-benzoquinol methylase